jgi:hypothetical protein
MYSAVIGALSLFAIILAAFEVNVKTIGVIIALLFIAFCVWFFSRASAESEAENEYGKPLPQDLGPGEVYVDSFTSVGVVYVVNLKDRSCTCPDWAEKRYQYFPGEPMRLCKHLVKVVVEQGLQKEYGSEARALKMFADRRTAYYPSRDKELEKADKIEQYPEGKVAFLENYFGEAVSAGDKVAVRRAFGGPGPQYMFTINMYSSRLKNGQATSIVPKGDSYRWRFETLARSGVAKQGRAIPTELLLEGLKMQELRDLAARFGGDGMKFMKKKEGCAMLATVPDILDKVAAYHRLDDFFRLEPLTLDQIRSRWGGR